MKKSLYIIGLSAVLSACSLFQKTRETEALAERPADLIMARHLAQRPSFESLRMTGRGSFEDGTQQQSFRFEIRMTQDSLIWVSLKDPFLGITVARGLLTKDSLRYYNSLDRSYYRGPTAGLAEILPFPLTFDQLFPALTGGLLLERLPFSRVAEKNYLLYDHDPTGAEPPDPHKDQFYQAQLNQDFQLTEQSWQVPTKGERFTLQYSAHPDELPAWPRQLSFQYQGVQKLSLDLQVSRLETAAAYPLPFHIPKGYERIP